MNPICDFKDGLILYRGKDSQKLIGARSFSEMLVFMLSGDTAEDVDPRCQMVDALLAAWMDHGEPPPSTQAVRAAASVGAPFIQSAISGFSMFGWDHAPVDNAAELLLACQIAGDVNLARSLLLSGAKIPGFGHPVHRNDPRASRLLELAKLLAVHLDCCRILGDIELSLAAAKKPVSPNLAGVTSAIWLDMGFRRESVGLIALAGRAVGLAAHHSEVVRSGEKFVGTPT